MLVVMKPGVVEDQISSVVAHLEKDGFSTHRSDGEGRTVIGVVGDTQEADERSYMILEGVHNVLRISEPYKLAGKTFKPTPTEIDFGDFKLGGKEIILMAGPCTIENEEMVYEIAKHVKQAGARILRGGAFKPRTSPYSFQGMGEAGLKIIRGAADKYDLKVVSEVMDATQIPLMMEYVDILQVGTRNAQNFSFLKELGLIRKPVLLKRGFANTYKELLLSAEYIMAGGNHEIILCERGIRTFETSTRNCLDLSAIPMLKSMTHLPIVVDPSHALGIRDKIPPMSLASVAAGTDSLIIEVHHKPEEALCDGAQSLLPSQLMELTDKMSQMAPIVGRTMRSAKDVS
jgi:3-deoxy-7-phosphoheptulonate synthase